MQFLISNAPCYITIYHEASLLEEKLEDYERAIGIAQMGLEVNPKYGPIWFTLLRLYERVAQLTDRDLHNTRIIVEDAVAVVPKV